jgi:hypothetical protein
MTPILEENKAQAEALMAMHGPTLELIFKYGEEFRKIIDDFAVKFDRTPTANELLWIASQHAGRDLRKSK